MDDDEWWQSLWQSAGDREKTLALLIFAAFFLSIPACALAAPRLQMSAKRTHRSMQSDAESMER